MKKLIDKLLWEEGINPFSWKFNYEKSLEKILEYSKDYKYDNTAKSIISFSPLLNDYFKEICKKLKEITDKCFLSKEELTYLLIANLNRTELIISYDSTQLQDQDKYIDYNSLSNTYIHKGEFLNNKEPAWGLIDSAIDITILNLDYLGYIKLPNKIREQNNDNSIDVIFNLHWVGSFYNTIKQGYDRVTWGKQCIKEIDDNIYFLQDESHLMLQNAGLTRLSRNILYEMGSFIDNPNKHPTVVKKYYQNRTHQEIDSIEYGQDFKIKYKKKERTLSPSFCAYISPLLTYYPFFENKLLHKLGNLTLFDLVNLYSLLHDLIDELPIPSYEETGIKSVEELSKFNPKVPEVAVRQYLKTTSKYTYVQIDIFLNLLKQKGKKHDLYKYPIYCDGEDLYFTYSIFKRANMLYLIDKWLEVGGSNLADRGKEFELYIRHFLKNEKMNGFAKFSLIESTKFSFTDNLGIKKEEEIDIVLILENKVIIGEIKCIMYPFENSNYYNSYQIIKKAKQQLERKAIFIEEHWNRFEGELGSLNGKTIEKIIIVNFPHFSGRVFDGIPVADFYLFLSYFKSGKLSNLRFENGRIIDKENLYYYNSVESFGNNFSLFFKKPIPIEEIIKCQQIENYRLTMGNDKNVIAQRVIYNPDMK